jgi:L-alanine-DL-glutamate epimerase-like enolase superfamily enzyme
MRITAIHERTVTLGAAMRNAGIGFGEMTASAVAVVTDVVRSGRPVIGYGFSSIGRYGHGGLLRERFIPRLIAAAPADLRDARMAQRSGRDNLDPFKAWAILMRNEKPGGHGERSGAVGVLDMALWDLVAKIEDKPLWRVLSERFNGGKADASVAVYASGGHYAEHGLGALGREVRGYFDLGYRTIKIKAGANGLDDDRRRIDAALGTLPSGARLAIDVNCAHADAEAAVAYAEALEPYRLAWIEEIVDPLDFEALRTVAGRYGGALATGENLFSLADARNLLRYGGLRRDRDLLQLDIPLSYGLVEYLRIVEAVEAQGWSRRRLVPHAGHLFALHCAAGLGLGGHEAAPDEGLVYGGFVDGTCVEDGRVRPPDLPGIGFEGKANLYAILQGVSG